ncbi:AtpZ/AtpI family protein [Formicincola oecophyllae]
MRVASDLLGGILTGAGIGYGLDWFAGTKPAFLIAFTLLGFGAGMMNVWRIVSAPPREEGADDRNGSGKRGQRKD